MGKCVSYEHNTILCVHLSVNYKAYLAFIWIIPKIQLNSELLELNCLELNSKIQIIQS